MTDSPEAAPPRGAFPPPPALAKPAAAPRSTDDIVDAWFCEKIHDSPVSRQTDIFNYIAVAVADLKSRLEGK